MKEELKMQIIRLRIDSLGYKKIATALNIPVERVKYTCKCSDYLVKVVFDIGPNLISITFKNGDRSHLKRIFSYN